jgi:hypothetical protein
MSVAAALRLLTQLRMPISQARCIDLAMTKLLYAVGNPGWLAKSVASVVGLTFNF